MLMDPLILKEIGVVLKTPNGEMIERSVWLKINATNNAAEYKDVLAQ